MTDTITCPECAAPVDTRRLYRAVHRSTCGACGWRRDWRTPRPTHGRRRWGGTTDRGMCSGLFARTSR